MHLKINSSFFPPVVYPFALHHFFNSSVFIALYFSFRETTVDSSSFGKVYLPSSSTGTGGSKLSKLFFSFQGVNHNDFCAYFRLLSASSAPDFSARLVVVFFVFVVFASFFVGGDDDGFDFSSSSSFVSSSSTFCRFTSFSSYSSTTFSSFSSFFSSSFSSSFTTFRDKHLLFKEIFSFVSFTWTKNRDFVSSNWTTTAGFPFSSGLLFTLTMETTVPGG